MPKVTHNFSRPHRITLSVSSVSESLSFIIYGPYGFNVVWPGFAALLSFNGQRLDRIANCYFLGNGCRAFFPELMRFNSPDSMSPFESGGINSYAYCLGDPINLQDPSGHIPTMGVPPPKNSLAVRGRAKSMGALINRTMKDDVLQGWDLIGYHGGAHSSGPSLKLGLDPKRSGTFAGNLFGKGFYTAPRAELAAEYAWKQAKYGRQPQLYEVYVENFNRLRPERDVTMHMRGMQAVEFLQVAKLKGVMNTIDSRYLEVVIRPRAYFQVEVRMAELRGKVVYPRSHEAPF